MKINDYALVLHRMPYSENSLLVRVFTRNEGQISLLFQGGKKKWGNILHPLAQIELTYYRRKDSELGKISAVELLHPASQLPFDPIKSSIAFFLVEFLQQITQPDHPDPSLFELIQQECQHLENHDHLTNYPLWICSKLAEHSGIHPQLDREPIAFLDLKEGLLGSSHPLHGHFIQGTHLKWMLATHTYDCSSFLAIPLNKIERNACFEAWMNYFQFSFPQVRNLKSIPVLKELFS